MEGYIDVETAVAIMQQRQQELDNFYLQGRFNQFIADYEYIDERYGLILRSNPGVYQTFLDFDSNKIGADVAGTKVMSILQGRLARNTSGSSGPSTAQRAANIAAEIRNMSRMFGLPDQDFNAIAWKAAQNNWDIEQIRDMLADQINFETAKNPGFVSDIVNQSKAAASDYFVKLSEEEALGFAKKVASGDLDPQSIKTEMARRAKAQYSWLSGAIDSGATLKEYFDPHRKTIAEMMEISPESVDFVNNPEWSVVINRPPDASDSTRREMSLSEVQQLVRSKDKWSTTQNARSVAADGAAAVASVLGAL